MLGARSDPNFWSNVLIPILETTDDLVDFSALITGADYLPDDTETVLRARDFLGKYRSDVQFSLEVDEKLKHKWGHECYSNARYYGNSPNLPRDIARYSNLHVHPRFLEYYETLNGDQLDDLTEIFQFYFEPRQEIVNFRNLYS